MWIFEKVVSFLRGWVRGHDDGGMRRPGGAGEIGIVHEGDVRTERCACGEM